MKSSIQPLSLQDEMMYADFSSEPMLPKPSSGFSEPTDYTFAKKYIKNAKQDLASNGQTYTRAELQKIRDGLKKAYSCCKFKKDSTTLSEYRSSLATISRLDYQAEMTEGKTLDEVMTSEQTDMYQKMIFTRRLLVNENYLKIYSPDGLRSIDRAYAKINKFIEDKANNCEKITIGEQNAYQNLRSELDQIKEVVQTQKHSFELTEKLEETQAQQEILKQEESISRTPELIIPKPKHSFKTAMKFMSNKIIETAVAVGIMCAVISGPIKPDNFNPEPISQTAMSAQLTYQNYSPRPNLASVPRPRDISPHVSIPKPDLVVNEPKVLGPGMYEIKPGDTLWKIAEREFDDPYAYRALADMNGIENPGLIEVGRVIRIEKETKLDERVAMNQTEKEQSIDLSEEYFL